MGNGYPHSTIAQILEDIISKINFNGSSHSNIADILLSILNQTSYDKEPYSVLAELFLKLKAKIEGVPFDPYDKETHSVIADILVSILNETEYTDVPQSRIAELLLELKEELESYTEITVSGSIVSFTTNVSKPLVKLKADVEAQQDLHGYDKPWAGGAGKNKLPNINKNKTNFTIDDEEFYTQNNPSSASWAWSYSQRLAQATLPSGNYVLSFYAKVVSISTSAEMRIYTSDGTELGRINCSNLETASISFTLDTETTIGVVAKIYAGKWAFQVEQGSTATAWTPYENICPISGWSGANVTRTGKNVLTMSYLESGSISGSGSFINSPKRLRTSGSIYTMLPIKPSQVYTYSLQGAEGVTNLQFMEANEYSKNRVWLRNRALNKVTGQYTPSEDCYFVIFLIRKIDNSNIDVSDVNYLQLEVGSSTETSYEPYNGNTYTISFGDTYYGGELDVTNGVLRVTHNIVDLGSLDWTFHSASGAYSDFFDTYLPSDSVTGIGSQVADLTCSIYQAIKSINIAIAPNDDGVMALAQGTRRFIVCDKRFTNATDLKNALNGVILVYELATPFTIQLSPTEIDALVGDNTIFADTGDVAVTYIYRGTPET